MVRTIAMLLVILLTAGVAVASTSSRDFAAIDAHARSAPESAARSIDSLASYLTKSSRDDREKARAIFCWIAHNITYDISLLGTKPDPQTMLDRRRAVCAGYAVLFSALAEAAGLKAEIVHGGSKSPGPAAAIGPDGLLNHDWNAVEIDGAWGLVDCTWGAGRLDERGRFSKHYTDHYFLTPPNLFAYDHLPDDPRWQLLDPPLPKETYLRRVKVQPAFFECGLRLLTHGEARIDAGSSLTVRLGAPPQTLVVAALSQNGADLTDGYTFAQRAEGGFTIDVVFPSTGDYTLMVFARERGASGAEYDSAIEYSIHARSGTDRVFPKMYASFQERDCHLDAPFDGILPAGTAVEFRARVPGAEDVVVGINGLARHLAARDGVFSGTVLPEQGQATLFARFPGNTKYEGLLRYHVR
jgi:hypothetical protein